ncbi:hypothetical protein PIB30_027053 [Stylosanthes scabra]|uniref:Uncharacterized protein n=1 Tax=Stylosanthes scabra TaxID=79078 RepID=A0ABU6SB25_9FABA|nr:hypothetical protein [Stylosanthes scabra]
MFAPRYSSKSEGEAYLIGLEDALQFLLEEINATHEEFTIVGYHKDILLWLKGETNTSWEKRFFRNRSKSKSDIFQSVNLCFKQVNQFKGAKDLEQMAARKTGFVTGPIILDGYVEGNFGSLSNSSSFWSRE